MWDRACCETSLRGSEFEQHRAALVKDMKVEAIAAMNIIRHCAGQKRQDGCLVKEYMVLVKGATTDDQFPYQMIRGCA